MAKPRPFEKLFIPAAITGLFIFGLVLYAPKAELPKDTLSVSFLNVGQGDAALVKTPANRYILIDGGPDKSVLNEMGRMMPPTEKNIEAVILTHPHADHALGLNYVLDRYRVKAVYLTGVSYTSADYESLISKLKLNNIPVEKYFEGRNIYIDEVGFEALWPKEDLSGQTLKNVNDSSIVFNLSYKDSRIIFMGDLSAKLQDKIVESGQLKPVQIIKVPHHGSKTGISGELLKIADPKIAIISVGANNSFGHPSVEILDIFVNRTVYRTDTDGTITFVSDGKTFQKK